MKIQFWGAAKEVTGSMHLLQINGKQILLDCGMVQGKRKIAFERNRNIPFEAQKIDALVLSHAHIDHSGNIPNLVKNGFNGRIYCTSATRDLAVNMLLDAAHIQEDDVRYVNKKRAEEGKVLFEPLYTMKDVMKSLRMFVATEYEQMLQIAPGVQLTFYDAGHILGSAAVCRDIVVGTDKSRRLVYSGDIGRDNLPILRDPEPVPGAELVIMESTYGDRLHETTGQAKQKLKTLVHETIQRKGKLIIPSFAVGRTQELIYHLHQLLLEGQIPQLPVYVDSPLAVNITDVFRMHPECFDDEYMDYLTQNNLRDMWGFRDLTYVRDTDESKALNDIKKPVIIISASGMCEAGRILHHLKNNIENPQNTILFVGYQAEDTLGRKIVDGFPEVNIFGETYKVKAHIEKIEGYSAHADKEGLREWAFNEKRLGKPEYYFIVHGEEASANTFADVLRSQSMALKEVIVPALGDTFVWA
jgi:metallo-beta-lactamase family protein